MKTYFYGVKFEDQIVQGYFDLLCFLANPEKEERHYAHVTLRGPCSNPANGNEPWMLSSPGLMKIKDVEKLNVGDKIALVFSVSIKNIQEYWFKPDYPEGVPHLTIYFGPSGYFLDKLEDIIKPCGFLGSKDGFKSSRLQELSKLRPDSDLEHNEALKLSFETIIRRQWPGYHRPGRLNVQKMNEDLRLRYIQEMIDFSRNKFFAIPKNFSNISYKEIKHQPKSLPLFDRANS